jgi:damage-control phosphatase, subfamily I
VRIYTDCIPCHVRQALNSIKMLTKNEKLINEALKKSLEITSNFNSYENIFFLYKDIQEIIKNIIPGADPYKVFKEQFNKICMNITDDLKKLIQNSSDKFEMGLKICLSGNSIDVMQGQKINEDLLKIAIEASLKQKLDDSKIELLKDKIQKAKNILFIGDNSGEIVFDKIFIELLKNKFLKNGKIIYVVRGGPTLNDATMEDAILVGMDKVVKVITTGAAMPAAYFPLCSEELLKYYTNSDLVISKGQGNLEALIDEEKDIFFLLKIKCSVIAEILQDRHKVNDIVIESMDKIGK